MEFITCIFLVAAVIPAMATLSVDQPMIVGLCRTPKVTANFKAQQFFENKWYNWKSIGNIFFKGLSSCAGTDSKINGDQVDIMHFQYDPILRTFRTITGSTDIDYIKMQGLPFPVNYPLFGVANYTVTYTILGTDYDNWAAVYLCHQYLGFKLELSWILVRDIQKTPTVDQQREILEVTQEIGYNSGDYRLQDNSYCGSSEPHL